MTETLPTVALLFDDTELGGQLRDALQERGARIVHEDGMDGLDLERLLQADADVLVVNLDDGTDDALDRLYEVIDGDRPRVVFNDGQVSRALAGWDRARWARHLAAKVLATGDIDPPRPANARAVDSPLAVAAASVSLGAVTPNAAVETAPSVLAPAVVAPATTPVEAVADWQRFEQDADVIETAGPAGDQDSENLAAELEALLAGGELPPDEDFGAVLSPNDSRGDELPLLDDDHFARAAAASDTVLSVAAADIAGELLPVTPATAWSIDHLQLAELGDATISLDVPVDELMKQAVSAPASWALLDDDASPDDALGDHPDAKAFGLEKLSAADYLAPDVEQVAQDVEAVMSLELVSMEEAIAPQSYVHESIMSLDELGSALSRVVLLGAAVDGAASAHAFLAALPATTRLTFLYTQHMDDQPMAALIDRLREDCALPLRVAVHGETAVAGEVLLVPPGHQVSLLRNGAMELQPLDANAPDGASIDASLTMAAGVFGRDALAIVFAGQANDAVAGSQAIHDRGGQVWVESSSGEYFADMVSGIFAERLVSFSGTPQELAAHLIEVFP